MNKNKYNQSRSFNLGIAQDFDIATALLFDELSFWADKGKRTDGFIYKTIEELQERLPLSKYQINKAQDNLVKAGFLEKKIMRANGSPTTHYRLLKNLTLESEKTLLSESEKTLLSITATNTATNNRTLPKGKAGRSLYGDRNINGVLNYWKEKTQLPVSDVKKQRNGASILLKTFSYLEVKALIDMVELAHRDKYATKEAKCLSIMDLARNKQAVMVYGKGKVNNQKGAFYV